VIDLSRLSLPFCISYHCKVAPQKTAKGPAGPVESGIRFYQKLAMVYSRPIKLI